jgi:hypothetical protein
MSSGFDALNQFPSIISIPYPIVKITVTYFANLLQTLSVVYQSMLLIEQNCSQASQRWRIKRNMMVDNISNKSTETW